LTRINWALNKSMFSIKNLTHPSTQASRSFKLYFFYGIFPF
jgi:hypothetical protein